MDIVEEEVLYGTPRYAVTLELRPAAILAQPLVVALYDHIDFFLPTVVAVFGGASNTARHALFEVEGATSVARIYSFLKSASFSC